MIDARTLFAKAFDPDLFAQDPQKAMDKLTDAMKKGQVKAKDLLPKVYKLMHDTYGPVVEKGINNIARQQERFNNNLAKFKNIIFMGGLERGVSAFYGGISELLVLLKPLAAALGGVAEGLGDVFYYFRLGVAYIKDWMVQLGLLDFKTNEWKESTLEAWSEVGQAVGWVLGVLLIGKIAGLTKKLIGLLGLFREVGAAGAVALAGGGAVGAGKAGKVGKVAGALGKGFRALPVIGGAYMLADELSQSLGAGTIEGGFDWLGSQFNKPSPSVPTGNSMYPIQKPISTYNPYGTNPQPTPEPANVNVKVNVNEEALKNFIDVQIDNSNSNILNDINSSYPNK